LAESAESQLASSEASREEITPAAAGRFVSARLRIKLLYSDGDPGAGLQVRLNPEESGRDAPSARRRSGRSDAAGQIDFEELRPGGYQLEVLHPSHYEHELVLAAGETRTLQIHFEAGIEVLGKVLNRQGQPVSRAAIWSRADRMGLSPLAFSDAQGSFLLRDVQPYFGIGATSPEYAPSPIQMIQGEAGDRVEVELVMQGAAGTVRGLVLSRDAQPVEDALIVFPNSRLPWTFLNGDPMERVTPVRCRSDAEGRFVARGLPPLDLAIEVRAEGHGAIEDRVLVQEGTDTRVTLRLTGTASVHGRVLDQQDRGLPEVRVIASSRPAGIMGEATSKEDGSYRIDDLTPGEINLQVLAAGKSQHKEVNLVEGEDRQVDLVFASGLQLSGQLVDEAGQPLESWSIAATSYRGGSDFSAGETNSAGEFLLEHMKPDCLFRLMVTTPAGGYLPNLLIDGVRPGGKPMRIVVPADSLRRGSIRGRVLDSKGDPMKGYHMRIMHMQSEFPAGVDQRDDGAFLAEDLPAGRYSIFIALGPQVRNLPDLELSPGEVIDLGTIQAEELGSLSLQFLNPAGMSPKALTIFDQDMRWIGSVNLVNGVLEDYPMVPGSQFVQVQGPGLSSRCIPVVIRPGEHTSKELRLEAGRPVGIHFNFADPEHAMTRLLYLRLGGSDGKVFSSERLVHRDGRFSLQTFLPPGVYSYLGRCVTGAVAEGSFEVTAARRDKLNFEFQLR
jgi:protocatechuate 3,4-dioxygenase beta subunit